MSATRWAASISAGLLLASCAATDASDAPTQAATDASDAPTQAATDCAGVEQGEGESTLVEYHEAAWPYPDFSLYEDADQAALQKAASLVDFNDDDFAGSYVCETAQVVVVATTDRGYALATEKFAGNTDIVIRRGDKSLADVNDLGTQLVDSSPSLGTKWESLAIDPRSSALKVGVFKALSGEDKTVIEDFAAQHDLAIAVYIDPTSSRGSTD
jgi:hypothetical protein